MTDMSHRLYLTRPQAIDALTTDLHQYDPSPEVLETLSDLVLSPGMRVVADARKGQYWISIASRRWWSPMRKLNQGQLRDHVVTAIRNLDPADPRLPEICCLVFEAPTHLDEAQPEGLWIETGMEGFQCRQCGQCCQELDYHKQVTQTDIERWQAQGRQDILDWVAGTPDQGQPTYRIWVQKGQMRLSRQCPWLSKTAIQDRYQCSIQDTKPEICRSYPGSRKHALKTGCKGFETC